MANRDETTIYALSNAKIGTLEHALTKIRDYDDFGVGISTEGTFDETLREVLRFVKRYLPPSELQTMLTDDEIAAIESNQVDRRAHSQLSSKLSELLRRLRAGQGLPLEFPAEENSAIAVGSPVVPPKKRLRLRRVEESRLRPESAKRDPRTVSPKAAAKSLRKLGVSGPTYSRVVGISVRAFITYLQQEGGINDTELLGQFATHCEGIADALSVKDKFASETALLDQIAKLQSTIEGLNRENAELRAKLIGNSGGFWSDYKGGIAGKLGEKTVDIFLTGGLIAAGAIAAAVGLTTMVSGADNGAAVQECFSNYVQLTAQTQV